MPTREQKIAHRVLMGMTKDHIEDWQEAMKSMRKRMGEFAKDLHEGDTSDLKVIARYLKMVPGEQVNLDDMELDRDTDLVMEEVARLLNDVENEERRRIDEERAYLSRCRDMGERAKVLAEKFEGLEKRV